MTLVCRLVWDVFFQKHAFKDKDGSWEGADFVLHWWVFSLSSSGPLCSILQHCKASGSGCESVSRAVMDHNGVTKMSPLPRTFQFCSLAAKNIFFKSILSNTKTPSWMQQYLCFSPKINNEPSYTTHPSPALWIQMESTADAALCTRWLASITRSCPLLIMLSLVISRVSGSSTDIEWAQREELYAIKKTENPLTQCHPQHEHR